MLGLSVVFLLICRISLSVLAEFCDNGTGECKDFTDTDCPVIFFNQHLIGANIKYCDKVNDIVCCPLPLNMQYNNIYSVNKTRRFERECLRYNQIRPSCRSTPFILGGTKAVGREFPFMALVGQLIPGNPVIKWDCGGTLIHPRFILTAAHCLTTSETKAQRLDPNFTCPKFVVRLGELDYDSTTDEAQPQDFQVINYVVHPFFDDDEESRHHDIALMELEREALINEYVAPACLPSNSGNDRHQLTATGWGYTRNGRDPSTHLLKVTLERFSDDICRRRIEANIDVRTQFCAGSTTSNADTCNGDSGGPMFVQHPSYPCLKQIIGITSFGLICGDSGFPSVYTKVHLFSDWIENIVWGQ